ncbi:MAG: hypothetical protein ACI8X5_001728 [Planctomycetota bacterium]|jgi:hypothetical protein
MLSKATTGAAHLEEFPADRRATLEALRKVINKIGNEEGDEEEQRPEENLSSGPTPP